MLAILNSAARDVIGLWFLVTYLMPLQFIFSCFGEDPPRWAVSSGAEIQIGYTAIWVWAHAAALGLA